MAALKQAEAAYQYTRFAENWASSTFDSDGYWGDYPSH
jgi:hypothetical protein